MNDTDIEQLIKDWKLAETTEDYDPFWCKYGDSEELVAEIIDYLANLLKEIQ